MKSPVENTHEKSDIIVASMLLSHQLQWPFLHSLKLSPRKGKLFQQALPQVEMYL